VYAVACSFRMKDFVKEAARNAISEGSSVADIPVNLLAHMTALQYHALLQYHRLCLEAANSAVSQKAWLHARDPKAGVPLTIRTPEQDYRDRCVCSEERVHKLPRLNTYGQYERVTVATWVLTYLREVETALAKCIDASAATDPQLTAKVYETAGQCPVCKESRNKLWDFSKLVAAEIDTRVGQVRCSTN